MINSELGQNKAQFATWENFFVAPAFIQNLTNFYNFSDKNENDNEEHDIVDMHHHMPGHHKVKNKYIGTWNNFNDFLFSW